MDHSDRAVWWSWFSLHVEVTPQSWPSDTPDRQGPWSRTEVPKGPCHRDRCLLHRQVADPRLDGQPQRSRAVAGKPCRPTLGSRTHHGRRTQVLASCYEVLLHSSPAISVHCQYGSRQMGFTLWPSGAQPGSHHRLPPANSSALPGRIAVLPGDHRARVHRSAYSATARSTSPRPRDERFGLS